MRPVSLLCCLILLLSTSVSAQNDLAGSKRPTALDSLTQELQTIADRQEIPGFAVALVKAEGVIFEKGFGYADLAAKRPYTPRTVQNIGSISKTFIGISLVQAERAGSLSLDDPINC